MVSRLAEKRRRLRGCRSNIRLVHKRVIGAVAFIKTAAANRFFGPHKKPENLNIFATNVLSVLGYAVNVVLLRERTAFVPNVKHLHVLHILLKKNEVTRNKNY